MEPLFPDACRTDRSAPCRYWHTKCKALNGGRSKLSERDLALVGVDLPVQRRGGGWYQPGEISLFASAYELDAEPDALLQALVSVGSTQARLDFLGG